MGREPGQEPGHGDGTGGAPGPVPVPGPPGDGAPGAARPSGFALGGEWGACAPSAALAAAAEAASGPGWRCDGLSRDEMTGLLRRWQALESWAAAGKLGVLRALIRDEDQPLPGGGYHGDLPEGWTRSLTYEAAAALAMPVTSAENLMWLAWDLQARLPVIGEQLAAGELTLPKARAIGQALGPLTDEDAATAEAMIIPELPGKTHAQVAKLAEQAAITVDPQSAARRRQEAERSRSRVQLFREESGATGLSGRDLPADQALAAHARVCERAAEYKDSGAFGEARMDQLRAIAYLDLINGTTAASRIASGQIAAGESRPGTGGGDLDNDDLDYADTDKADGDDPGTAGSACADGADGDVRLRPPPRITRLPAQRHPAPPRPGTRRRMHLPHLLPARQGDRLRTRCPLRQGRNLRLQRRIPQPPVPPRQTVTRLDPHPAQTRLAPVDNPRRPHLHPRAQAIPGLDPGGPPRCH